MPLLYLIQCAWCTRIQLSDKEWSEPLGRNVKRFHRRRVEHGMCPDCEERVFASLDTGNKELIAD